MYEGFSNEPTWMVSFHINNDAKLQEHWLQEARDHKRIGRGNERFWLASELETKFKATLPKTASGIWGSILDYVFNQIVWTEVAEELLDKLSEMEG